MKSMAIFQLVSDVYVAGLALNLVSSLAGIDIEAVIVVIFCVYGRCTATINRSGGPIKIVLDRPGWFSKNIWEFCW